MKISGELNVTSIITTTTHKHKVQNFMQMLNINVILIERDKFDKTFHNLQKNSHNDDELLSKSII